MDINMCTLILEKNFQIYKRDIYEISLMMCMNDSTLSTSIKFERQSSIALIV